MLLHQAIISDDRGLRRAAAAPHPRPPIVLHVLVVVAVAFGMACRAAETGAAREPHLAEAGVGEGEQLGGGE